MPADTDGATDGAADGAAIGPCLLTTVVMTLPSRPTHASVGTPSTPLLCTPTALGAAVTAAAVGFAAAHRTVHLDGVTTSLAHVLTVFFIVLQMASGLPAAEKYCAVLGHATTTGVLVEQSTWTTLSLLHATVRVQGVGTGVAHALTHVRAVLMTLLHGRATVTSA